MKSTPYIAIILFFLMLLMVLGAAFIFLFQAQVTLEERLDNMATAQETLVPAATIQAEIGNATRVALETDLTAERDNNVLLEADLVDSQQQLQELNNALTEAELALVEANRQLNELQEIAPSVRQIGPSVEIVLADEEAALRPLLETAVWVVAANAEGITAVSLIVNDEEIGFFEPNNEQLFVNQILWTPPASGSYRLVATVVSQSGDVAQAEQTVTVTLAGEDTAVYETTILDQIEANIASIRGVLPLEPVERIFVSEEELAQRLAEQTEPSEETAMLLTAFGLDIDALPEPDKVLSFYDPNQGAIYLSERPEELSSTGQAQYAREYFLALQDQQDNLSLLRSASSDDARVALWALAEGEANLVAEQFAAQFLVGETADFVDHNAALMQGVPGAFLRLSSTPGEIATRFAQAIFDSSGGYEGLDDAWFNLPASTEQVLDPTQYPDGLPEQITLPSLDETLGAEWTLLNSSSVGVWGLRTWLGQEIANEDVETAVVGWEGDAYAVYQQAGGNQLLLVLRIAWETPANSEQFDLIFNEYGNAVYETVGSSFEESAICWQGEDVLCIITAARDSLVVRAPSYSFITAVLDQLSP